MAWFLVVILSIVVVLLLVALGVLSWKSYQWANAIFIMEDDLENASETLSSAETTLNKILTMQLFFDSPEVKEVVSASLNEIKMCKFEVNKLALTFTERSKQRFTYVVDDSSPEENAEEQMADSIARRIADPARQALVLPTTRNQGPRR
jgi:capsular polysaccharide biosynthesis protein